jgi:hypothetical protein
MDEVVTDLSPLVTYPSNTLPLSGGETDMDTAQAGQVEVVVGGVVCTPSTHVFDENGNIVLKKDGTPKRRPGPQKGFRDAQKEVAAETTPTAATAAAETFANVPQNVALSQQSAPATATVTRTVGKVGAEETVSETIEIKRFVTAPAQIDVGYGMTLNIGNYESARLDVRISIPCYREEVEDAYEYARKWAEAKMQQQVQEIRTLVSPKKSSNPF